MKRWPLVGLVTILTLIAGGFGITYAAGVRPAVDGTIYARYNAQHVGLVENADSSKKNETNIAWNQQGHAGDDGLDGWQGPRGIPQTGLQSKTLMAAH